MASSKKTAKTTPVVTRAEKRDGAKQLIRELLKNSSVKASELIDEAAKIYAVRFGGEDTENPNDVKGRIGSVLDVMKKEGDVTFDGGMYALNAKIQATEPLQKTEKKPRKTPVKKAETEAVAEQVQTQEKSLEKKTKKTPSKTKASVAEKAEEPAAASPKKRGRKAKTQEEKKEEIPVPIIEEKTEESKPEIAQGPEKQQEETAVVAVETGALSPKGTVMDMSFLFGMPKAVKAKEKPAEKAEENQEKPQQPMQETEQPVAQQEAKAPPAKPKHEQPAKTQNARVQQPKSTRPVKKTLTADEQLQAAFLNKLHRLSGEYFEYFSVYLLERYSRQNGRRLEMLRISAGEHDGGIDGELELTDRLGFRETIYVQAKNWDPDKGDEKLWVVGETLLQQFLGACACRQAKDGKQNCRGIFITTSRFTPEAKRLLDMMSDKLVGYDGADLYEAAKECSFGIVKKNGAWVLDEQLLSGEKAFFQMY